MYIHKTFKSVKGFTLIELLVVIAIIGLLSTIIAAPIQNARKKAKDAKKIAEVKGLQLALDQFAESNRNQYPYELAVLSPQYMPILPLFYSSTTSSVRDAFAYTAYIGEAIGAASTTFGYHLGAKLETYGASLETDRDCAGGSLGPNLYAPQCVVFNGYIHASSSKAISGTGIQASSSPDIGTGLAAPFIGVNVTGEDFMGNPYGGNGVATAEPTTSTCVGNSDCIFDVTAQQ